MAKSIVFQYTFDPSTDTVKVDGNVSLKRLLLITNVTDNIILYNFADTTRGVSSSSYDTTTDETTIVLNYDCSAMSPTDDLQIFIEQDVIKFQGTDALTDPVSKFRVSQPNTLIDTDFEYGLQATKWETLERMNEIPAFHSVAGDVPLSNVLDVTTNGTRIVTVTCSSPHGISTGTPIDVRGVDSVTAEGTFVVKRTTDNAFSYEARAVQAGTVAQPLSIITSYVNITSGRFYVGANITLDNSVANTAGTITTDGTTILTVRTPYDHGFKPNAGFALVNSLSKNVIAFDPLSVSNGGQVDDRSSYTLSTGAISIFEPYHMGTTKRTIAAANISTVTHEITITNHGLITGDPIAYVGVSAGGSRPGVNSVGSGDFTINAGFLPTWATAVGDGNGMLFAVVIDKDKIRIATNPKDAYNSTNLIQFNGTGSGNHDWSLFQRGDRVESNISTLAATSGSAVLTVTLTAGNSPSSLGLFPSQQVTIAGSSVSALNGVYVVRSTNWSNTGTTFEMEGPTDAVGVLVNQAATQTYTLVNSGGNGTTSFDRYNIYTTVGFRVVEHTSPYINHTRVSIHDWKATTTKYWFRQCINPGTDRIFIKNHGLTTGEPIMYQGAGNTWTGGTTAPVDSTVYFASVINKDVIELYTTENGAGVGPYSAAVGTTKVNFSTSVPAAGGVYALHPGFTIANFTTFAATGGAGTGRDRVIAQFANLPSYVQENTPIVIKAGTGSTIQGGLTNTPDSYTSYQKYYVETIMSANTAAAVREFSLTLTPNGAPINFLTANAVVGAGKFYGFRIEENPYSNSIFLINHGGTAANQATGGSGGQGTYPVGYDYPGPLFDLVTDGSGRNWPRVRMTLTAATPVGGLTNAAIYNMVPVNNNVFKMQAYSTTVLPTGAPTIQITSIAGATASHTFTNTSVQNPYGNRVIIPSQSQLFVENALVRYENNGGVDIGSPYVTAPGLINNTQYIVKGVQNDVPLAVPGLLSAATAVATSLTISVTTRLAIGDYIKVNNEVMIITNIVSTTLTVTRGASGTTAAAIEDGQVVEKLYGTFQLYSNTQTLPRQFTVAFGSANATTDTWTFTNHGLRAGETVMINSVSTGGTWGGALNTLYYVIVVDANTFSLALSPALAYAQYPIDITAVGTAGTWNFRQFYNAIPLAGLATSTVATHSLEDVSSTGTLDGSYTLDSVPSSTSFTIGTIPTIGLREFKFSTQDQVNLSEGVFYIPNHGFQTGTKVTYSKNGLTYSIGESATGIVEGYTSLTDAGTYYVISRDLSAFRLALTKADAINNVAIRNFNSAGTTTGAHKISSDQIAGDSLAGGLATVVARDIVVDGGLSTAVLAASDRIVFTNHGFATGDRVVYQPWAGATAIQGLVAGRQYFVNNTVNAGVLPGGAATGQSANQFSLHNTWVGAYTNTDRVDILGVGTGKVHQFKVTNPTLTGTTFKGDWNAADNYIYGDVVLFRNAYYMSLSGNVTAASYNVNRPPTNDNGRHDVSWMVLPTLPNYATKFLTTYRGGDNVKISNTIVRRTIYFDGSLAARVVLADNVINFTAAHGLTTGDAVIYRTDALGGSQAAASDYDNYVAGVPSAPITGLVPNRIYYVGALDATNIALFTNPADAVRGGSGDTGNFQYAINLSALGSGVYHRFDLLEHATYTVQVLAVNNDREMIVTDPYPSKAIVFNPQESFNAVTGLATQIVSALTDEILLPAHGLNTGVKVYYSIGPANSGTAIGGLTDGATYYVIRVNADVIRLATTLPNAMKNLSIDLTNTGTGFNHYIIAATASGSSWIRYNTSGDITSGTTFTGTTFFTGQTDGNIRDGVLTALPIINETQLYARPDCMNIHRPFDGGVEINASKTPNVAITRQTRKYFRYQSGKGLQYSTGLNFSPNIDVSRITHDGTTYATVSTRRPHKLTAGNKIRVENVQFGDEYEAVKCERDLGYILRDAGYDITLGTNYNAVFLGLAQYNSYEITPQVITAISLSKQEVAKLTAVSSDPTSLTRSNTFFNEVIDIAQNGRTAADSVTFTNPSNATTSQIAAKDKLIANLANGFIQAEINAWVNVTYPAHDHDEAKCSRDVGYAVNAIAYDILYGGNSATYENSKFFFYYHADGKPGTSAEHRAQTVAAYNRLQTIVGQIVQGQDVAVSAGNAISQIKTGNNATSNDALVLQGLIQVIEDVLTAASQAAANALLPNKTFPSITWSTSALQASKQAIDTNAEGIIDNVVRGAPYIRPVGGSQYFQVFDVLNDFSFRYVTNGIPADLAPSGFANLFVHSWTGAVVRAGMFDDQNGLFFEYDGQELHCVRRNSTKQLGGVANVVNKGNSVIGVSTNFTKQLAIGDLIVIRGMSYKVTKVESDTALHISPSYRGTTRNGVVITKTEDLRVPQHRWSVDKCDGTGPSGLVLNINRMQMAYMDYSWYGAGKVRFGFKGPTGGVIYVHDFIHNNREVEAYMRSGNLPARYEIKNGDNPTYAPSLYHWGASVIMDGVFEDDKAYLFTVASGSAGSDTIKIPKALAGVTIPILSLRLAPSVDSSLVGPLGERDIINRMSIALQQVGLVISGATKPASVKLVLNGALSQQAYFANYGAPSLTQVIKHTGQSTDSVTGGVTIYEFRAAVNSPVTAELGDLAEIGNSINGGDYVFPNGPDVLTVCIVPTDTAVDTEVTARISWKESQA